MVAGFGDVARGIGYGYGLCSRSAFDMRFPTVWNESMAAGVIYNARGVLISRRAHRTVPLSCPPIWIIEKALGDRQGSSASRALLDDCRCRCLVRPFDTIPSKSRNTSCLKIV